MNENKYRHEYKYLTYLTQQKLLETRIKRYMHLDEHVENGTYNIRSLYFDDYYNSCFYENENGTDPREKFRIRIYNHSKKKIMLECKRKENGKTLKTSCPLTEDQCRLLMRGKVISNYYNLDPLIKKLSAKMLNDGFKPSVIIEYDRIPYVYKDGNVRVTFDTNISSSNYIDLFLDESIPKRGILPVGMNLLEVKFDEFLPDTIYNCLQMDSLNQTAFSKFYLGRCYELGKNVFNK